MAAVVGISIFGVPLLAQYENQDPQQPQGAQNVPPPPVTERPAERKKMQFYADEEFNIEGTDTIVMIRNVVLHHNGSVVVCDSAVRYSENRFECFGNVIINQDSTYIYCQRALYDRENSIAEVFDDLIKIVNGTSTLYTYNFSFNTQEKVGRYWGGGTMLQDSNRMESDRGWYYSELKDIYAAGGVQMTDPEYKMVGDSVRYNTGEQVAEFYSLTYIWNENNEMLSATAGKYYNQTNQYEFTANAYILTTERELWSDSLNYNSTTGDATGSSNIQIRDEENQIMAFGDYGEYHGEVEEAMLTRNPALVGWDSEAPEDTVYMRSDSMFMFSVPWDSVTYVADVEIVDDFNDDYYDDTATQQQASVSEDLELESIRDSVAIAGQQEDVSAVDDLELGHDSITIIGEHEAGIINDQESVHDDALVGQQEASVVQELGLRWSLQDSVVVVEGGGVTNEIEALQEQGAAADSVSVSDSVMVENIGENLVDSLSRANIQLTDSMAVDSLPPPEEPQHDSLQRIMRAYRNVKVWRRDMQAVCDSLVAFTKDSTAHMYIEPVVWNEQNQITATQIDISTKNEELHKAVFTGDPIMVGEVDGERYNQIKGRRMESYFRDNEVYKHYVDGNAQTLYYMVDEGETEPHTFVLVNSATITFLIDSQQVSQITWAGQNDSEGYPIDQIPKNTPQQLEGFKWEAERRPEREDVFSRIIRPSRREEYMAIPQPQFPLTKSIEEHKRRMIAQKQWEERYELLPQAAIERVEQWVKMFGL